MAALLNRAQDRQQFGRFDLTNLARADYGVGELQQPFQLAQGDFGAAFPAGFVEPFLGNCLSDGQIGKYDATFLSVSIPSKIPSIATNLTGCGWTPQPSKTFDFGDFSGHLWTCPEEAMVPRRSTFESLIGTHTDL